MNALTRKPNGKKTKMFMNIPTTQKNINSSADSSFLNSHDPIAIKIPISGKRIQVIFKTLNINTEEILKILSSSAL